MTGPAPSGQDQKWNFTGINSAVEQLKAEQLKVKALLEDERAELADLSDIWGGEGSEAYQAEQKKFQEKAQRVNEALARLVAAAQGASGSMQSTEFDITGMFT
jgi:6 kDa early secretory antigenic target